MWIYPDCLEPKDKKPSIGDIIIATTSDFGVTERQVGIVVDWDGIAGVDMMILPMDPDTLDYYG